MTVASLKDLGYQVDSTRRILYAARSRVAI
jgi:hypothetical protein